MSATPKVRAKDPAEVWRDRALILRERIKLVLDLHRPPRHGGVSGKPNCTECGFPWPCETYALLDPAEGLPRKARTDG